ncbi:MAG: hypothetical protein F4Z20_01695 [Gammaproteobacteria bacterium]|nr:hypothetical protein [Gammaproteobacteria bacterium]
MAIGEFYDVALPWPEQPQDVQHKHAAAALGITLANPDQPTTVEKAEVTAVMSQLSARIEQYASAAPIAVKREACARFFGYLNEAPSGAFTKRDIGVMHVSFNQTFQYSHAAAFRNCGAAALLAPWRVRRAGVVKSGDDD